MLLVLLFVFGSFLSTDNFGQCAQPYFPSQITFNVDNEAITVAVDEINQRAYLGYKYSSYMGQDSFAMQHFPNAIPNSPESKNYIELRLSYPAVACQYMAFWKYSDGSLESFPSHWYSNSHQLKIGNYINFEYEMIHSIDNNNIEDYWYSKERCQVYSGEFYPCEEIYFKKDTEIPLRSTKVIDRGLDYAQVITIYNVKSVGKPDDSLFSTIPTEWPYICTDVSQGVEYNPQMATVELNKMIKIEVWLRSPPHRIHNNNTVFIQWKSSELSRCNDCVKWIPKQMIFNLNNFQEKQTLIITRVKDGYETLAPIFSGGGYQNVPGENYLISIS